MHDPGHRRGRRRSGASPRPTRGWAASCGPPTVTHLRGRHPASRAVRTPRSWRWARPATAARGATVYVTLEPCSHTRPHRPVRRRARSRPASPGSSSGIDDPDRQVGGAGHRRAPGRRHRGRRRACTPSGSRPSSRPTSSTAAPAGRGSCSSSPPPSTAAPRRPTARASGSPAPRPAPTATGSGPSPTRSSSGPAPSAATTRRSPCATTARRSSRRAARSIRSASCSARPRPSAKVHPCREMKGDLGDVLDELGADGVLQVLVEGGAHGRRRLPPRRPRRPLRHLPRAGPVRRRRRPRPVRRPGRLHDRRRLARPVRVGRAGRRRPAHRAGCRSVDAGRAEERLMFTGIVEELGTVVSRDGPKLRIARRPPCSTTSTLGDSIAVNGCCLTVVDFDRGDGLVGGRRVRRDLRPHHLGALAAGRPGQPRAPGPARGPPRRPPRAGPRRRGRRGRRSPAPDLRVAMPPELPRYVVEKGSITVDGVSLTVVDVARRRLHRRAHPAHRRGHHAGRRGPGDPVNLEVDVMAKYVERLLAGSPPMLDEAGRRCR